MFKRASLLCIFLSFLSTTTQAWPQQESQPDSLRILVEGEPSVSRSIIEALRIISAKYGLKSEFVEGPYAQYDLKLIVSGGNGLVRPIGCDCSAAQFYYNSIVAFTPDGKLLFTVSRSGDLNREAVEYAATVAIRNIYNQSASLKKQSTFNSGAPQDTGKPIIPTEAIESTAQGLPSEPGVYYKAGVDWIRLTASSKRLDTKGGFLNNPRIVQVYDGAHAKAQVAELKPEFYVRDFPVSEQEMRIVRLETKRDHREATIASVTGGKTAEIYRVTVASVSNGVHKITPASELQAGEYVLILYAYSGSDSAYSESENYRYGFGITLSKK